MKLLVISDTHMPSRSNINIIDFIKEFDFDYLIHCGDFDKLKTYSALFEIAGDKLCCVHGNSDEVQIKNILPESNYINYKDYRLGIIHSHNIYPRGDADQLIDYALSNQFDILFYGHTHIKNIIKYKNGQFQYVNDICEFGNGIIYLVNPGSLVNGDYLYLEI